MAHKFKHTPKPWKWVKDNFRGGYVGLFSGDTPVIYPQRENDGDDGAAWFGIDEDYYGETALKEDDANLIEAAPDLLEALHEGRRAIGEHFAPNDCYSTGPITGNYFRDLVQCPACSFIEMYDATIGKIKGESDGGI